MLVLVPTVLSNVAPWITTVGAGTLDRDFPAYLSLSNGTLIPEEVKGIIVLCNHGINPKVQKGSVVKAAGMVLANTAANGDELVAGAHLPPATTVSQTTGEAIKKYLTSDPNPTATILLEGTKVGIKPSPVVAAFSSRGPNSITQEVLKPDIIAPSVNIIAGWTGAAGPTGLTEDNRRVEFNIISAHLCRDLT